MVRINTVGSIYFNSNTIRKTEKKQVQERYTTTGYITTPAFFSNKYSVNFKGTPIKMLPERLLIEKAGERLRPANKFTPENITEILNNITPKSKPFMADLLKVGKKCLSAAGIVTLLQYINQEETDVDEFKEKFRNLNNLQNDVSNDKRFSKSVLSEHLDKIPEAGIIDLLQSDVLLRNSNTEFNSLPMAYNYAVRTFEHKVKKLKDAGKKIDISQFAEQFINPKENINMTFTDLLLLGRVFDRSVCNELVYNREKYVHPIYMPRLKKLNKDDLLLLRRIQTDAVTDKENKGEDLAVYEISLDDKICALNLLSANREISNSGHKGLNMQDYIKPVNMNNYDGNFKVDFQNMKIGLMDNALRAIGINDDVVDKYMTQYREAYAKDPSMKKYRHKFWDINYAHLLISPLKFSESRYNADDGYSLRTLIQEATEGDFKQYIFEKSPFAAINAKNKRQFESNGYNYEEWLRPSIQPIQHQFTNRYNTKKKTFTVRNWNRCPQESIYDGNYTTCCTGIDKDQGASFLQFMQNTCTTTLEVRTEKNKVIAMSRILLAKIDEERAMIIENIEVNNKMAKHYLYDDNTKYQLREMIFDYARNYANVINKTGQPIKLYFCGNYFKVAGIEKGLGRIKTYDDFELIGEFPNMIYVNSLGGPYEKDRFADDGDFKLSLIDITQKAKPPLNTEIEEESDSNYNHADVANYHKS